MLYLAKSWYNLLIDEFDKEYFKSLQSFLKQEYTTKTIFPPERDVFNALNLTKFDDIKV